MTHAEATGRLRPFFEAFEAHNSAVDAGALAQMFGPTILVAGPNGATTVTSGQLIAAVPRRRQLFEAAGWQSTRLANLDEQPLDERYVLARTEWEWRFTPRTAGALTELRLGSTFVVDCGANPPRIVAYFMHHDLAAVLAARGLLPRGA